MVVGTSWAHPLRWLESTKNGCLPCVANRHGPKPGSKLRSQRKLATSSGRRPQTSAFMCRNFQSQILWTKSGHEFSDIQISRTKISRTFSASEMRKVGSQISLSLVNYEVLKKTHGYHARKLFENPVCFTIPGAPNSMIFLGFLAFQAFKVFQAFLLISQRPPAPTHPHEIEPTIDIDHLMVEEN